MRKGFHAAMHGVWSTSRASRAYALAEQLEDALVGSVGCVATHDGPSRVMVLEAKGRRGQAWLTVLVDGWPVCAVRTDGSVVVPMGVWCWAEPSPHPTRILGAEHRFKGRGRGSRALACVDRIVRGAL